MLGPLVLLTGLICAMDNGQISDHCTDIEVRADTCADAVNWLQGWIPAGFVLINGTCGEQRIASK